MPDLAKLAGLPAARCQRELAVIAVAIPAEAAHIPISEMIANQTT
jgi:hypothetical protein